MKYCSRTCGNSTACLATEQEAYLPPPPSSSSSITCNLRVGPMEEACSALETLNTIDDFKVYVCLYVCICVCACMCVCSTCVLIPGTLNSEHAFHRVVYVLRSANSPTNPTE